MKGLTSAQRATACTFLLASLGTGLLRAQQVTGDFVGTVTDAAGAVVPHAQVTVQNTGTHEARTVMTSATGEYTVSELQPGQYTIVITAPGFKRHHSRRHAGGGRSHTRECAAADGCDK